MPPAGHEKVAFTTKEAFTKHWLWGRFCTWRNYYHYYHHPSLFLFLSKPCNLWNIFSQKNDEKYHHVSELKENVCLLGTFHFFKNGKKVWFAFRQEFEMSADYLVNDNGGWWAKLMSVGKRNDSKLLSDGTVIRSVYSSMTLRTIF